MAQERFSVDLSEGMIADVDCCKGNRVKILFQEALGGVTAKVTCPKCHGAFVKNPRLEETTFSGVIRCGDWERD